MLELIKYPSVVQVKELSVRPSTNNAGVKDKVMSILENVRIKGDKTLAEYAFQFDGIHLKSFAVSEKEINAASKQLDEKLKKAIRVAYKNIYTFHVAQREKTQKIETMPGVVCWRRSIPIDNIGLYIPGGTAPLFSTVLMLGIPAKIGGCKNIVLCTPPHGSPSPLVKGLGDEARIHPAILFTAQLCGIKNIYKVGGAQAIAAMAYGTQTIPKVDKIFGPGNQYVTTAKQMVSSEGMAIDMPAGPSELCIIADKSCNPEFIAADLLSQAEHGADSQVLLISDNEAVIKACMVNIVKQLDALPRKEIAEQALGKSKAVLVRNLKDAIDVANKYAPEHLILACKNYNLIAGQVRNAGSVFLGNYSPESAGDYASGTNHTLPTNGYARSYSGVSLDSFVKKVTFQEITKKGIKNIGKHVEVMAKAEGLVAHKRAISVRLKSL